MHAMMPSKLAEGPKDNGYKTLSQCTLQQQQSKQLLPPISSLNASRSMDPTTLASISIPDKFKKYPGFLHPYRVYIQDGQTFVVETFVSAGGFGSVFKAVNRTGVFAIKAQKAGVSIERDRQIRSEARFLKRSAHANVVQFLGEFRQGDHLCLRLEWMPKTVLDIIRKRATLQETRQIILGAASGLRFLHKKNFVHRDVKPENVLVSGSAPRMAVKIADFGLAGYMKDGRKLRGPCGTRTYQAPEMLEDGGKKEYGSAVDMFSLGVILRQLMYNMLPCDDLVAVSQGKKLIENLLNKEDLRFSAEMVLEHPFVHQGMPTAVQQQQNREHKDKDHMKKLKGEVEEKTNRPREVSEEKQGMARKSEQKGSETTEVTKFKSRKHSDDIRKLEQKEVAETQGKSLPIEPKQKRLLVQDTGEVEEKKAKRTKLTPDPACATEKTGSTSASANSVKGYIPHPHPPPSPH
ncbi:hypothetical protein BG015_001788 [Linnemannia schmuckeri]|uniref:Protein kinase domain-containing protein n=1 Tax=Linnemannia schmuckeri TaxID=64567 RepID=A0A9P5RPJ9_9FUNG|nr:hypothetical protein BG015_001788 [Linnemannia schmuckeri]